MRTAEMKKIFLIPMPVGKIIIRMNRKFDIPRPCTGFDG
jgi:hypothetical protein